MPRHSVKKQTAFTNTVPRNDVHVCHAEHNRQLSRGLDETCHCEEQTKSATSQSHNLQNSTIMRLLRFARNDKKYNSKRLTVNSERFNYNKKTANCLQFTSYCKIAAFTLAEVLITLTIIGVVAAMTMPSLIAKHQEKQTVTALKKFYSTISQAYIMSKIENGSSATWPTDEARGSKEATELMAKKLIPYLKVTKVCGTGQGCFPDVVYNKIDGTSVANYDVQDHTYKIVTADGMSVFFYGYGKYFINVGEGMLKKSTGAISVDINGKKGPNTLGVDLFSFQLTDEGIVPVGTQTFTDENAQFPNGCRRENCLGTCEACAAWVIYNENMDYLHCDDLSWDGKTKCK